MLAVPEFVIVTPPNVPFPSLEAITPASTASVTVRGSPSVSAKASALRLTSLAVSSTTVMSVGVLAKVGTALSVTLATTKSSKVIVSISVPPTLFSMVSLVMPVNPNVTGANPPPPNMSFVYESPLSDVNLKVWSVELLYNVIEVASNLSPALK